MRSTIYLDWAAAAVPSRSALRLWQTIAREHFANPASLHRLGQAAETASQDWRSQLARTLAVKPHQLHFTAGATAANQLVLALTRDRGLKVACLATDHDSVRLAADLRLPVKPETGTADWAKLKLADDVGIISLAGINNETGISQPWAVIKAARRRLLQDRRRRGCDRPLWLHVDGSQMVTVSNCQPQALAADLLTINGVKCGAPKRTGCLFASEAASRTIDPAGHDQFSLAASGTESLANVAALALAVGQAQARAEALAARLSRLQAGFEIRLTRLGGQIVGLGCSRSPHITNCCFRGIDNERLALALSHRGIEVGVGSACQAGSGEASSTLTALGLDDDQARGSLRFSFGWSTTARELQRAGKVLAALLATGGGRLA